MMLPNIYVEFRGNYGTFEYKTMHSVGADLTSQETYVLHPTERCLISTEVYITHAEIWSDSNLLPELQVRPKSGLSLKGIDVTFGSIDSDYIEKEIKVCLVNNSKETFIVNKGDRVAQLVCAMVLDLKSINRKLDIRVGGFGSTGSN